MRKRQILCLMVLLGASLTGFCQVGIGTATPAPSSALEVQSTVKGFLPPRMTTEQRNMIAAPALGLTIFNTSTNCLNFYVGDKWKEVCGEIEFPEGTVICSEPTSVVDVVNPVTGKTWMDRNLGALQKALSTTDANAYGDLYQWGRGADGHQCRFSYTTTTLSGTNQPGHGNFILSPNAPFDWRDPQNTNLWQGANGVNNPCPGGYRLPTLTELNDELLSWVQAPISSTNNANGAFASPLKFTLAGFRNFNGTVTNTGSGGYYWSSTVNGTSTHVLHFNSSGTDVNTYNRGNGYSVRCIKE